VPEDQRAIVDGGVQTGRYSHSTLDTFTLSAEGHALTRERERERERETLNRPMKKGTGKHADKREHR
jgi:hypothetical protein